jgi:DNA processing protein
VVDSLSQRTGDARRAEVEALLLLDGLPRVGPAAVRVLVELAGSATRALRLPDLIEGIAGADAVRAALEPGRRDRIRRALDVVERLGMEVRILGDRTYPASLLHLADPPPVLFLRGRTDLLETPGVGIVGARRSTERARRAARRIAAAVARVEVAVVSGMALGVDAAAHAGALDTGGPTVAVLGSGPDVPYPRRHARLFRRILADGLVVSEFLPGTPALPYHFPRRNRILAALCHTVVVAEARARSGALITVEHALDLGLDVWAVPGPFGEDFCAGSNALLADGARALVTVNGFVRMALGVEPGAPRVPTTLSPREVRLLEVLAGGSRTADELARTLGLSAGAALALLAELELRGAVAREPGMRFRRAG